jgi:central glycolytic genes regulator
MIDMLQKRYNILRTIYYNQPIGRRILANNLGIGERIVRTEINLLKEQNLIEINTPGMTITPEGEEVIERLKDFIHDLKGLSEIENQIKAYLGLKNIIIVPGNVEEDITIMRELGKSAANCLKNLIKDNSIIALTGGNTIREVVDNMPRMSNLNNVMVVPARGGMGRNLEIQANNLAAHLADKIGANYRLLHVPDNLSNQALTTILNEVDVKEVVENINHSNVLLYGIGRADEMGRRRGLNAEELSNLEKLGAVGEAFGYYFNRDGEIVFSTPTIGVINEKIHHIETLIAIAAGKHKAEAIMAIELNNPNSTLITDESAAREIINIISKKE